MYYNYPAITCLLPSDQNLQTQPTQTVFNIDEKYTVECAAGYKPNSGPVMTCGNTGKFDKDVKCIGKFSLIGYLI